MSTLIEAPSVIEDAPVYHYPDGDPLGCGEAVCDGIKLCGIAAHVFQGETVYTDVPVGTELPADFRWATVAELDAIHRTHPTATPAQLEEIERIVAELQGAGWLTASGSL